MDRRALLISLSVAALAACERVPDIPSPPLPEPEPTVEVAPQPEPAPPADPIPLPQPKPSNFPRCLANVLVSEGGNDDDKRDPGGRTSRGIIQREWTVWCRSHHGLPADVWRAPQDQIEAIYREKYWNAMRCDELAAGVDYCVADYGINAGIGRAPKVLQRILRRPVTGRMDDATVAAAAKATPRILITSICDERLRFLKSLRTWKHFGKGWGARVASVKRISLRMADPAVSLFDVQDDPEFGPGKAY